MSTLGAGHIYEMEVRGRCAMGVAGDIEKRSRLCRVIDSVRQGLAAWRPGRLMIASVIVARSCSEGIRPATRARRSMRAFFYSSCHAPALMAAAGIVLAVMAIGWRYLAGDPTSACLAIMMTKPSRPHSEEIISRSTSAPGGLADAQQPPNIDMTDSHQAWHRRLGLRLHDVSSRGMTM